MTSDSNPYSSPQAEITHPTQGDGLPLASPWLRLAAIIVDFIIVAIPNYFIGKFLFGIPGVNEVMDAAAKGPAALEKIMPGTVTQLLSQVVGIAVFIGINFNFLKRGQTIGKMALKLQMQHRATGALLPVQEIIIKRMLPLYGISALGGIRLGPLGTILPTICGIIILVDVLLIFRQGRNCLHDDIAQTKVVKLPG